MTFCEKLNNYIEQLECSSQELANASGLSSAVISRYRNGERTPNIKSKQLESLSNGLHKISIDKKVNISKEEIYNALANTLSDIVIDFEQLSKNFSELVSTLNISIADLARSIRYDSSFVSRIRTGSRNPSKPKEFIESVSSFIVAKYSSPDRFCQLGRGHNHMEVPRIIYLEGLSDGNGQEGVRAYALANSAHNQPS